MNYLASTQDVITTSATVLHIKNSHGDTLELLRQKDGKLRITAHQNGQTTALRLNQIEVQHLRELLK